MEQPPPSPFRIDDARFFATVAGFGFGFRTLLTDLDKGKDLFEDGNCIRYIVGAALLRFRRLNRRDRKAALIRYGRWVGPRIDKGLAAARARNAGEHRDLAAFDPLRGDDDLLACVQVDRRQYWVCRTPRPLPPIGLEVDGDAAVIRVPARVPPDALAPLLALAIAEAHRIQRGRPAPTDPDDEDDDDDAGEEWKFGGTALADRPSGRTARDDAPTVSRDTPLPADDRASGREFYEALWRSVTPLPLPPNLPDDFYVCEPVPTADGFPPRLCSGAGGTRRRHCPHCGRPYKSIAFMQRHLVSKHGWRWHPDGHSTLPPARDEGDGQAQKQAA